jgi:hypothetical protein
VRVIAFSLWGRDPKYVVGALRNADLAPAVYPGWICRFYCGASTPESAMATLESQPHVQVVRYPEDGDWGALFWRFLAASDREVEFAIFRDADSRLGARERAAVDAWIASNRGTHVMRDHPRHSAPILGGMWGVRRGVLPDMAARIAAELQSPRMPRLWQIDQEFLAADIAPIVERDWLEHDEYFARKPFPTRRRWREYVGQPFDEHDRPLIAGPTALRRRVGQATRGVRQRLASALTWPTTPAC